MSPPADGRAAFPAWAIASGRRWHGTDAIFGDGTKFVKPVAWTTWPAAIARLAVLARYANLSLGWAIAVALPLVAGGCMVGPDFRSPAGSGRRQVSRSQQPLGRNPARGVSGLVDGIPRPGARPADRDRLQPEPDPGRRRHPRAAGARRTGGGDRRLLPAVAAGDELADLRPAEPRRPDRTRAESRFPASGARRSGLRSIGSSISGASSAAPFNRPTPPTSRSIASYDDVLVTLLGDVATTYIGIRTLETQIDIAQDNIVKQKKALAIAEARYHGGVATKLDVYQAENVLGQTESTIPQLTAQLDQGLDALRVLLGMAPQPLDAICCSDRRRSRCRPRASRSASPPIWCAAGRTSARPSWRRWRRVPRSASPRRSSTRRSACSAASARSPAISPATSSAIW